MKLMSVLDKLKTLEERRHQLLEEAKKEATDTAQAGISEPNALSFHYMLVEGDDYAPATVT
jgi:hypothetical protein